MSEVKVERVLGVLAWLARHRGVVEIQHHKERDDEGVSFDRWTVTCGNVVRNGMTLGEALANVAGCFRDQADNECLDLEKRLEKESEVAKELSFFLGANEGNGA